MGTSQQSQPPQVEVLTAPHIQHETDFCLATDATVVAKVLGKLGLPAEVNVVIVGFLNDEYDDAPNPVADDEGRTFHYLPVLPPKLVDDEETPAKHNDVARQWGVANQHAIRLLKSVVEYHTDDDEYYDDDDEASAKLTAAEEAWADERLDLEQRQRRAVIGAAVGAFVASATSMYAYYRYLAPFNSFATDAAAAPISIITSIKFFLQYNVRLQRKADAQDDTLERFVDRQKKAELREIHDLAYDHHVVVKKSATSEK